MHSMALLGTNFSTIDWIIVVAYLMISLVIGLFVNRYTNSMVNYLGAGRAVGTWLGIATMTGTELGLVTVMYSAQKGFTGGFAAFHIAMIAGFVTLLVGISGFIIVPLRRTKVLTIPEFYERRFSRSVRVLGGIVLATAGILNMGLFLKIGSVFIVVVTGLDDSTYALPAVMTGLLALVLIYTTLGGMVSVIITDYIQFVVLSFGLLITCYLAISQLGWDHIFDTIQTRMNLDGFSPLASKEFGPSYITWMCVMGLVMCAVWPTALARALTMKSESTLKLQYSLSSVSFVIRFLIPYFWGICALVYFTSAPGDFAQFLVSEPSPEVTMRAMPTFLSQLLPTGMLGIVSAGMIAAFMSTHDSYLLCWSSVITQDVIAPLSKKELSDKQRLFLTRLIIVLIGIFIWFWGIYYKNHGGIWEYMAITGAIYFTGAIPLLIGGLYWRGASSAGAFSSLLVGSCAIIGLKPIRLPIEKMLQQLLEMPIVEEALLTEARVGIATVVLTIVVFIVVSLCVPDRDEKGNVITRKLEA
jgi:SSS family solute:Na+ symporter